MRNAICTLNWFGNWSITMRCLSSCVGAIGYKQFLKHPLLRRAYCNSLKDWTVAEHSSGFYQSFLPTPDWNRIKMIYGHPAFYADGEEAVRGFACVIAYMVIKEEHGIDESQEQIFNNVVSDMENLFIDVLDLKDTQNASPILQMLFAAWLEDFRKRWEQHFERRKLNPESWAVVELLLQKMR